MKKFTIFRKIFCIALFLGVSISVGCNNDDEPVPVPTNQEKIDEVVRAIRAGVETEIGKVVPSLSVFVQTANATYFSSDAGEGYQPSTADTYFRFASNTKNFTAAAALNMQEDGWLNIEDKITDTMPGSNLPYVPVSDAWDFPYKDQITIRMLLNHSAGVYDVDNDPVPGFEGYSFTQYTEYFEPDHQFTAEEMVEQLTINQLSYFPPGEGHHYSNAGYAIVGEIIARIYSFHADEPQHLSDYLYDFITGPNTPVPLNVYFPYLATDQSLKQPYSCGYVLLEQGEVEEYCSYNMSAQVAEGNGFSTMRDLNTYIRTLLKGENALTPASIELMKTATNPADPTYGLGCFYKENLGYGHNGARIGNMSIMIYDPENDVSIITYINAINTPDFVPTYMALTDVAYGVREILGFPYEH